MSSGISSKPEQAGHGSPFLSFSTIFNNYFLPDKLPDLMATSAAEQHTYSIKKGDIFLTRTSETLDELGMSCVALKDIPKATFSGFAKRLRPRQSDVTDEKFMGFYLRSKYFRKTMTNNAIMTLRASLNEEIFSYLKLYLPDIRTQRKIGTLLHLFNAKIELNNRINAELEAMAKVLYDYWFVQFDFPNTEGKPYKSSGGKMIYNAELKREIPAGWEVRKLADCVNLDKSGDWGKDEPSGNYLLKVTCLRGTDLQSLSSFTLAQPPVRYILEKNKGKILKPNDLIIEISGGSPTQSTGRIGILTEGTIQRFDLPLICSNFCRPLTLKDPKIIFNFTHAWSRLYEKGVFFSFEGKTTGIKNLLLDSVLESIYIPIPPSDILTSFYQTNIRIQEKIQAAISENRSLASLRDWLLPMLMNGQVTVG